MDVKELLLTNVSIVHKGLTGNVLIDFGKANISKFRMSDIEVLNSK